MAKRIIWSFTARTDRKQILQYWVKRSESKEYSKKLNKIFEAAVKLISEHPHIGTPTVFNEVRSKVVRDYQIFYEETEEAIYILTIWDSRQDPMDLSDKIV